MSTMFENKEFQHYKRAERARKLKRQARRRSLESCFMRIMKIVGALLALFLIAYVIGARLLH